MKRWYEGRILVVRKPHVMPLMETLTPARVKVPLAASTRQEAIRELIDLLADNGDVVDRAAALRAVLERERTRSTAIGEGLAVPHAKTDAVHSLVCAVGRLRRPVDFAGPDGKPVTLVALLLSPPVDTGAHIQALARLSRLLSNDALRRQLNSADTRKQIVTLLRREEERLD
jgi:fructose-specific phosphotransferase system IIA component